jgi:hypothetical protein
MPIQVHSISSLARRFGVPPQVISGLFYRRLLDDRACPVVNGRRLIPDDYIDEVERCLRARGLIRGAGEERGAGS